MKIRIGYTSLACAALTLLTVTLPTSATVTGGFPHAIGIAGDYSVDVQVLPPASFTGPKAELVRDGGGEPASPDGAGPPNHRLAVIVWDDSKVVQKADVVILYRNLASGAGPWLHLPVVRAHLAGKGLETTQYGNNVRLGPGRCEVSVSVNGQGAAVARFLLRS